MPHVIGADESGIIKEIGSDVSTLKIGYKVTNSPGISCVKCEISLSGRQILHNQFSIKGEHEWDKFAEFFKMPEINVLKLHKSFPLDNVAAAPLSFLTAYKMLKTLGDTKPGDFIYIYGAGGVSSAAVQIPKHFGAKIIITTSSPEKIDKAKKLGDDYVINYKEVKDFIQYVYKKNN